MEEDEEEVEVEKEEEEDEVEWRPQQTRPARHAQLSLDPPQSNCSMFCRLVKSPSRSHLRHTSTFPDLQPVVLILQESSLSREGGRHHAGWLPGQGDQGNHHHQQHLQAVIQYFSNSSAGKSFENA